MLTIKRPITNVPVTIAQVQATIIEEGHNTQTAAEAIFALFNPEPQYETEILRIGQIVRIVSGMKYEEPTPGTICKVVRIEWSEEDSYTEVCFRTLDGSDYNELRLSDAHQDISQYAVLI